MGTQLTELVAPIALFCPKTSPPVRLGRRHSHDSNELREFRTHVERHYVEKDEIPDLRISVDKSIDRMQSSLDLATATMGDVRDAVLVLTAKGNKPTV